MRGLFVRTIGLARARLKIGLANLAYNMRRAVWLRPEWPRSPSKGAQKAHGWTAPGTEAAFIIIGKAVIGSVQPSNRRSSVNIAAP